MRFIILVEEATWLFPIVVVPKKNDKFIICVDFKKWNATTKNDPYILPFTQEVLDMVARHELYSFLDGFSNYRQIMIVPEERYKTTFITDWGRLVWIVLPFGLKDAPPMYQRVVNMAFREYLGMFLKLFLNNCNVFNDVNMHLDKLWLCFDKCWKFDINLKLEKCMFLVYLRVILGYVVSKEGNLHESKNILAIVNMLAPRTPKNIQVFNGMV